MSFSGIPEFTIDQLAPTYDDNSYCGNNLGLDEFSYLDSSNIAGPSQPYFGVDVWGDFNNYPNFPSPSSAPMSLFQLDGGYPSEGYNSFHQGSSVPSSFLPSPQPATIPTLPPPASPTNVPALSHGSPSLSPGSYALPITPTYYPYAQDQAIAYPDSLEHGFPAMTENFSLPIAQHSPAYDPSLEELWYPYSQSGPQHFGIPFPGQVTVSGPPPSLVPSAYATLKDAAPAATPPPAPTPVASSSGPQRTRQSVREGRRFDPVRSTKQPSSKKDGWEQTLVRFRAELDAEFDPLRNVHDGQPSGGLVPEMALAIVNKYTKENLKRSPLRGSKAGEGTRSRNGEKYLEGLLQVLLPEEPTSGAWSGSHEKNTTIAILSRLANELEGRLTAVNQQPALLQAPSKSNAGTKESGPKSERQEKRNKMEKDRRDRERHQLGRITCLFKVASSGKPWSRKDALSLGVLFLIYGPSAFHQGSVEARPAAPTL